MELTRPRILPINTDYYLLKKPPSERIDTGMSLDLSSTCPIIWSGAVAFLLTRPNVTPGCLSHSSGNPTVKINRKANFSTESSRSLVLYALYLESF